MALVCEPEVSSLNLHKWLTGVGEKLSDEGQLLLKLLYYRDLQQKPLVDKVEAPRDLHDMCLKLENRDADATLAIFIHRLSLLVPRPQPDAADPARILKAKDLGARECLDYLQECHISQPPVPVDDISPESKLLECLVKAYANMSPRKRGELKEQLAKQVGVHSENFNVFQLFCRLFQSENDRFEDIVGEFVNILNNCQVPLVIFEDIRGQLDDCNIPHGPLSEEINTQEETDEDYETAKLLKYYVPEPAHTQPKCTRRRIVCCFVLCIPIMLVLLAITVVTPILSTYNESDSSHGIFEVSSENYPNYFFNNYCYNISTGAPLIRLGTVYSFWYSRISITQIPNERIYTNVDVKFYAVPSENVVERIEHFYCESDIYELRLEQLYLLKDSHMTFNICVMSQSSNSPGWVNLTIYDDLVNFSTRNEKGSVFFWQYKIHVKANGTNCSKCVFTAPHNSLYYTISGAGYQTHYAKETHARVDVGRKYINSTDWADTSDSKSVCTSDGETGKECTVPIEKDTSSWLFSARNYDMLALVTSEPNDQKVGHLQIQPTFRSTVYSVPTVAGVIL